MQSDLDWLDRSFATTLPSWFPSFFLICSMASVPWTYDPKPQKEGQSHSRAPHFDGTDYSYWKQRMAVHMKGIDPQMWKLVLNGFT